MNLTKETITTHFKLNAKKDLKAGGLYQAYLQGAEDCYDYIKENEEKKIRLDWESKCAELQSQLNCTVANYEDKLRAKEQEIQSIKHEKDILMAKVDVIKMIFGK